MKKHGRKKHSPPQQKNRRDRILVIGRYLNPTTYELRTPDGNYFTTIREGKNYKIGKYIFFPFREQKKNGNGTIISLKRFDKKPDVSKTCGQNSIPLHHNRYMWWALTPEAIRNGGVYISASHLIYEEYENK